MGTRTDYELSVYDPAGELASFEHFLDEECECGTYGELFGLEYDEDAEEWEEGRQADRHEFTCKWYGHNKDLKRLSDKYRGYVFRLYGMNEHGSEWVTYYRDGKMQEYSPDNWTPPDYDLKGNWV